MGTQQFSSKRFRKDYIQFSIRSFVAVPEFALDLVSEEPLVFCILHIWGGITVR